MFETKMARRVLPIQDSSNQLTGTNKLGLLFWIIIYTAGYMFSLGHVFGNGAYSVATIFAQYIWCSYWLV